MLGPEHRHIRFRCRAQVCQGMEETKAGFSHQRSAVYISAADGFRYPVGVAGKKVVIFRCSQVPNQAQLNNQLID